MVTVLKIQIPTDRAINSVEYYQHSILVGFNTGLPAYISFQQTPAARMFAMVAGAIRCYQTMVDDNNTGENNQNANSGVSIKPEPPEWVYDANYGKSKDNFGRYTYNVLPLNLNPETPIKYQHIAFLVGKEYAYVFTQDPKDNLLYCTGCYTNVFECAMGLGCWQPADTIQNPFDNPFEKNSFDKIALRQSKRYLPAALRQKLSERIKS